MQKNLKKVVQGKYLKFIETDEATTKKKEHIRKVITSMEKVFSFYYFICYIIDIINCNRILYIYIGVDFQDISRQKYQEKKSIFIAQIMFLK